LKGANVILACRDMSSCEEAKNEIITKTFNKKVKCLPCDLASLQSIKEFVDEINKKEKFVHILINNAGIMWSPRKLTTDYFESHLGINHLGHFYLTNLLLPKLRQSSSSRIISLVSGSPLIKKYNCKIDFDNLNSKPDTYDEVKAFNQSKLANILFVKELSRQIVLNKEENQITINCVDPGHVATDILRYSSIHNSWSPMSYLAKMGQKTVVSGAQPVIFAAVSDKLNNVTGKLIR
jgi:NAD(P)-dependent dehydrogenase (short-subunit alcohol dehydrogenase family)